MKRKLLFAALIFWVNCATLNAQTIAYLDANIVKAGIAIGGNLFSIEGTSALTGGLFETPKGSGKAEIYTATLWMSGWDQDGSLNCSEQTDPVQGYNEYFDGPIAPYYSNAYYKYYKRVFKGDKSKVDAFRGLNFPVSSSQVDSTILYWPGLGNPSVLTDYGVSIDSPLAPFVDANHNGIYDPLQGDYPAFVGDQVVFFVFNDISGYQLYAGRTPLGVEVRGMASCFTDTSNSSIPYNKRAINNSVFIQYEIENKSLYRYSAFHLGFWVDPDIGCFNNDRVGCDTNRNLMFAYNGVAYDPDCAPERGYDSLPVALAIQALDGHMDVFGAGFPDQVTPAISDPVGAPCSLFSNFVQGIWGDGTSFQYGKTGYNSGGTPTKFIFPGDPVDTAQWSDVTSGLPPGDRTMWSGSNITTGFNPGQTLHFDFGVTTAYDSTSNYLAIIDTVKKDADTIRQFYLHHIIPGQQTLGINPIPVNTPFTVSLYPNPSNNLITIEAGENIQNIELMDIEGRILLTKTVGATKVLLPVANLARGVYLLNVIGKHNSAIKKVVVE